MDPQRKKTGRRYSGKLGVPPGTLTHIGSVYAEKVKLRRTVFSSEMAQSSEREQWEELAALPLSEGCIAWYEVHGLHDLETIEKIGRHFNIHPLVMEDVLNTTQRPKFEESDDYLYFVLRAPFVEETSDSRLKHNPVGLQEHIKTNCQDGARFEFEQVSFLCGKDWVISFVESSRDLFAPIRERILTGKGSLRGQGSDYLAYALLDLMVDHFFIVLEEIGDSIEFLDEALVKKPGPPLLRQIHYLKRQLLYLHKAVWPFVRSLVLRTL